jgi:GGDEF domain-containing protein
MLYSATVGMDAMGLRNRAAWDQDLFLRLWFCDADQPLAIIFFDLDNFGPINKTPTSATPSETTSCALRSRSRTTSSVRPAKRTATAAKRSACSCPAWPRMARTSSPSDLVVRVPKLGRNQTASFGVAAFTENIDERQATKRVSAAANEAKRAGKNRVCRARE